MASQRQNSKVRNFERSFKNDNSSSWNTYTNKKRKSSYKKSRYNNVKKSNLSSWMEKRKNTPKKHIRKVSIKKKIPFEKTQKYFDLLNLENQNRKQLLKKVKLNIYKDKHFTLKWSDTIMIVLKRPISKLYKSDNSKYFSLTNYHMWNVCEFCGKMCKNKKQITLFENNKYIDTYLPICDNINCQNEYKNYFNERERVIKKEKINMSIQGLERDIIIKERFIYPNKDELKNGKKIPPYNDKSAY